MKNLFLRLLSLNATTEARMCLNSEARPQNLHGNEMGGVPNQLIVCMLSESWYGGYQLATVWRAVGHGGYQVSSVGNVRVEGHGGGASKELEYYAIKRMNCREVLRVPTHRR